MRALNAASSTREQVHSGIAAPAVTVWWHRVRPVEECRTRRAGSCPARVAAPMCGTLTHRIRRGRSRRLVAPARLSGQYGGLARASRQAMRPRNSSHPDAGALFGDETPAYWALRVSGVALTLGVVEWFIRRDPKASLLLRRRRSRRLRVQNCSKPTGRRRVALSPVAVAAVIQDGRSTARGRLWA